MIRALVILALCLWPATVLAAVDPSDGLTPGEIEEIVLSAMQEAGVSGRPVLPNTRPFPACETLPVATPRAGDWNTLSLRCAAPFWTRAIRTNAQTAPARPKAAPVVTGGTPVVTLTQSLSKGAVIEAHHLTLAPAGDTLDQTVFVDPAQVIGRRLSVNLGRGRPVQARHLDIQHLIEKGHPVAITFQNSVVEVAMPGKALESGQRGDLIEVRNIASGRILRGRVAGRNKIVVEAKMN